MIYLLHIIPLCSVLFANPQQMFMFVPPEHMQSRRARAHPHTQSKLHERKRAPNIADQHAQEIVLENPCSKLYERTRAANCTSELARQSLQDKCCMP